MKTETKTFYTFDQVSHFVKIPKNVLSYLEMHFYQIHPTQREGGKDFYTANDIEILSIIGYLLYKKAFKIKDIKKIVNGKDRDFILSLKENLILDEGKQNIDEIFVPQDYAENSSEYAQTKNELMHTEFEDVTIGAPKTDKSKRALLEESMYALIVCKRLLEKVGH